MNNKQWNERNRHNILQLLKHEQSNGFQFDETLKITRNASCSRCGLGRRRSEIVNLSSIMASTCKYLANSQSLTFWKQRWGKMNKPVIWQSVQYNRSFISFIHASSFCHSDNYKLTWPYVRGQIPLIFDHVWADSLVILCIFSQQICWNIFALHPSLSHLPPMLMAWL